MRACVSCVVGVRRTRLPGSRGFIGSGVHRRAQGLRCPSLAAAAAPSLWQQGCMERNRTRWFLYARFYVSCHAIPTAACHDLSHVPHRTQLDLTSQPKPNHHVHPHVKRLCATAHKQIAPVGRNATPCGGGGGGDGGDWTSFLVHTDRMHGAVWWGSNASESGVGDRRCFS